jgi:hypothetical protein
MAYLGHFIAPTTVTSLVPALFLGRYSGVKQPRIGPRWAVLASNRVLGAYIERAARGLHWLLSLPASLRRALRAVHVFGCLQAELQRLVEIGKGIQWHAQPARLVQSIVVHERADPGHSAQGRSTFVRPLADEVVFIEEDEETSSAVERLVSPTTPPLGAKLCLQGIDQQRSQFSRFHHRDDISPAEPTPALSRAGKLKQVSVREPERGC